MELKVGDGDSGDGGAFELSAGNTIAQGQAGGQVPKVVHNVCGGAGLSLCAPRADQTPPPTPQKDSPPWPPLPLVLPPRHHSHPSLRTTRLRPLAHWAPSPRPHVPRSTFAVAKDPQVGRMVPKAGTVV